MASAPTVTGHRHVYRSAIIHAPIATVWARIDKWFDIMWGQPVGSPVTCVPQDSKVAVDSNIIGTKRVITLPTGKSLVEELKEYSAAKYTYTYNMISYDAGAFPSDFINYTATLALQPVTAGDLTFATWVADFDGTGTDEGNNTVATIVGEHIFAGGLAQLDGYVGTKKAK